MAGVISRQPSVPRIYIEPFAGGAGVGLYLLYNEYVEEIVLNDLDGGVAAFWRSVFSRTDELLHLVRTCRPSIDEWHVQHERYNSKSCDEVELGFATFFLNRTNRSGILDARPIGGFEQESTWGITARYDAGRLAARIERLARYSTRVTICEEDGIELARSYLDETRSFMYLDPPYLRNGDELYLNTLTWDDHVQLARHLQGGDNWVLTYDDDSRVPLVLYPSYRCASFELSHTASVHHLGREYAVFPDGLVVETLEGLGVNAEFV